MAQIASTTFRMMLERVACALLAYLLLWTDGTAAFVIERKTSSSISPGAVSIRRGIDTSVRLGKNIIDNGDVETSSVEHPCEFAGTIRMGGPFSLEQGDKFFVVGTRQLVAFQLVVDYVNRKRCGVHFEANGQTSNYAIELVTYDDQSSVEWTEAIATSLVQEDDADGGIDIMLGGYSSTLTAPLAAVAQESSRLLLAPGAAATGSVFAGRDKVFGTFPPTGKYLEQAIAGLGGVGAKTIATIWEDASFTRGVCAATPSLAETYGLEMTSAQEVKNTPNVTALQAVAEKLKIEAPDVVVTCTYNGGCENWIQAMRNVNWSPKAQVFTVCVGLEGFVSEVGSDAEFMMGVTPWDSSLADIEDSVTGWSAQDFADQFRAETADADVTYHAASAASVMSIAVQALEGAAMESVFVSEEQPLPSHEELASYIASDNFSFKTMYGEISFDENGQSQAPSLLIQYDAQGTVQTVYPNKISSGPILYPMPSWDARDCAQLSPCGQQEDSDSGCDENGQCVCDSSRGLVSIGRGKTAQCIPQEEANLIVPQVKAIGYVFVGVSMLMALFCLVWVYRHKDNTLVRVSQPLFMVLLVVGCVISSMAILPLGAEDKDAFSSTTNHLSNGDEVEQSDANISRINASCMTVPWLWGIGFGITFSALFAKVWRVKKLYNSGMAMRRKPVQAREVMMIMVIVVAIEIAILTVWQVVAPLQWEREVLQDVEVGDLRYSTESVGQCTSSDGGWWFLMTLVAFNVLCLLYALILCFQTKDLPSDFAESSYIFLAVMFMFQILVLAIPVSAMVQDDTTVFYFIRACAIFFQNFTVLTIIFGPKMVRVYKGEDTLASVKHAIRNAALSKPPSSGGGGGGLTSNISGLDTASRTFNQQKVDSNSLFSLGSEKAFSRQNSREFSALSEQEPESSTLSHQNSREFSVTGEESSKEMVRTGATPNIAIDMTAVPLVEEEVQSKQSPLEKAATKWESSGKDEIHASWTTAKTDVTTKAEERSSLSSAKHTPFINTSTIEEPPSYVEALDSTPTFVDES
eukprot:CAMPEP_0172454748 /NCGR_PEP_ID=MMETSP1065-20121228/11644_1 /TAXON_ID=265537 /ORGANISM="Amphiprora paludosa, Strain CCMP125" /LENGTH=1032 /DNA_ID=CAMNT_0013207129 /DNA_START=2817 /DNA_END=5915 /DNA_ORIENTATION=+